MDGGVGTVELSTVEGDPARSEVVYFLRSVPKCTDIEGDVTDCVCELAEGYREPPPVPAFIGALSIGPCRRSSPYPVLLWVDLENRSTDAALTMFENPLINSTTPK